PSATRMADMAKRFGTTIVAGYPERCGDALHNAVMVCGVDGKRLLNYRKRVIPPGFEGTYFTPGDSAGLFELNGWKLAVLICYDVEFPEYVRQAALDGADMIIAPTALRSMWGFVADTMLPTRAFENGVYVLYANHAGMEGNCEYLGRSVILGPDGKEHARAGGGEALISATLARSAVLAARATLPYVDVVRGGLPG
ncbi:MAG: hydrolase, partial [Alphaproteobacteria bacterium]|nr:hydrolase [Alphaproteobacteria bacterium]